jgi:FkbM family methyltransferase
MPIHSAFYPPAAFLFRKAYFIYRPVYHLYKLQIERGERAIIRKMVMPGNCVLDIGANTGFFTGLFSKLTGKTGSVHAFEPHPQNFRHLSSNMRRRKNVIVNQSAIGSSTGTVRMYVSPELNVDHHTYSAPDENRAYIQVPCTTVDEYCKDKKVDFIKIDIQGFELSALEGMKQTIRNNSSLSIISELWPYGLLQAGGNWRTYTGQLEKLGFSLQIVSDRGLIPLSGFPVSCKLDDYYTMFCQRPALPGRIENVC